MKITALIFLPVILLVNATTVNAQWHISGVNINNTNSGNVGIGTTTPSKTLEVAGDALANTYYLRNAWNSARLYGNGETVEYWSSWYHAFYAATNTTSPAMFINARSGQVGIGTNAPTESLDVKGNINIPIGNALGFAISTNQNFSYGGNTLGVYSIGWAFDPWFGGGPTCNISGWGGVKLFTANQPRLAIDNSGNVGIGTTAPDAMLTVSGQVHAQEVKVTVAAPGPDYVFEKDYALPTLEQIKTYIDANKHLPEVPTAKEMEKDGVKLGEMNMILLKKMEEMTLYMIEQNHKIENQQKQIDVLIKKTDKM